MGQNVEPEMMVFRKTGKVSFLEPSWCVVNNEGAQTTAILILNICMSVSLSKKEKVLF